jgi:hypothetical protein
MKKILLGAMFVATTSVSFPGQWASQSQEPPVYPQGQFCTPKGDMKGGKQTTDHPCACKRHDEADPDDPENKKMCKAGEATMPSHDTTCKQWCNEQHCLCPVSCDTGHHNAV